MTTPLVSILINNFNYEAYLKEAILSALSQTYKNIEIIVVDDGSTDDSKKIIAEFEEITSVFKKNEGQASAFNEGFNRSKGDIICFLDSDDTFLPTKVETIVTIFMNNEDVCSVFNAVEKYCQVTKQSIGRTPIQKEGRRSNQLRMRLTGSTGVFLPATSGFSFRRSLLSEVLPMPTQQGITISDKYLGNAAISLEPYYYTNEKLSTLRIHSENRHSNSIGKTASACRIGINTAYWMLMFDSTLFIFCDALMCKSIKTAERITDREILVEHRKLIENYCDNMSFFRKVLWAALKLLYNYRLKISPTSSE